MQIRYRKNSEIIVKTLKIIRVIGIYTKKYK